MTPDDLAALRAEYELGGLDEADLDADPLTMFSRWFAEARAAGLVEANAMVLATSTPTGPSTRTVLLKGLDPGGFVFFTNYESRKAAELAVSPACALLFGWYPLQRQVRIEGVAEKVARAETEEYFASRPRDSQLGAWASRQSAEVGSREDLDAAYAEAEQRFAGQEIPAPPFWGGYRVVPTRIEFWQGRRGRMHDRLVYLDGPEGWRSARLAP
ncbi:pyridoxamine 5'-phosphate oxidase [Nocardioides marmoriginsengisoli]|uniref:Pyridoxine/pyridoxamine 5'-phosphate oxidase n=1 Tax=Nocardioides marmoriginsengisoli TaxID=661483 RepID=A0A3N0CS38_9ACTN|nr:pyridoxamine 5'-phosphate oxidase [Nocardioides marmoriginsengisoli]RNL66179.1 pyridoxamine 5'-phosphate oxidase [Nocardioides marmoriginsengisoli]